MPLYSLLQLYLYELAGLHYNYKHSLVLCLILFCQLKFWNL